MRIGIVAVQGAFAEHGKLLEKLNADYIELRKKEDLKTAIDGLILPGGESTVQGKLLRELDMFAPPQSRNSGRASRPCHLCRADPPR